MSDVAIQVEHIGKRYRIVTGQVTNVHYKTLRDAMSWRVRRLLRRTARTDHSTADSALHSEDFWALDDVSFEVRTGEVVGIIGRNGAGKSTLLKILSRITEPTTGHIRLFGRVGSLLEVGTGFHQEFSGRENIYLNGAILGMRKAEIERKFDEIVAFSEIEKFIDTPVKRYSSGMYVRLAFAVAAHLETEILLVDEVLAVCDAAFQKKCLGKMNQVAGEGRTVLFVSHNMAAVENLCGRVLWLEGGRTKHVGAAHDIISNYLTANLQYQAVVELAEMTDREGGNAIRITRLQFLNGDGIPSAVIRMGETMTIRFTVQNLSYQHPFVMGMYLYTDQGLVVSDFRSNHMDVIYQPRDGETEIELTFGPIYLYPRTYIISPWIADASISETLDWPKYAATFEVQSADFLGTGAAFTHKYGVVHIPFQYHAIEPFVSAHANER